MDAKTKLTWAVLIVAMSAMILAFSCSKASCAGQPPPILSKLTIQMFFTDTEGMTPEENTAARAESISEFMDILCFSYYSSLLIHQLPEKAIAGQLGLYAQIGRNILIPIVDRIEKDYHTGKIPYDSNFCSVFAGYFFPYLHHYGKSYGLDRYRLVPNADCPGNM